LNTRTVGDNQLMLPTVTLLSDWSINRFYHDTGSRTDQLYAQSVREWDIIFQRGNIEL